MARFVLEEYFGADATQAIEKTLIWLQRYFWYAEGLDDAR